MDITRRRFLLGGSLPTEGEMGEVVLTEQAKQIVLPNNFGTTNLMVMIRQTEGINEAAWATHGVVYFPYNGNMRIEGADRDYISATAESRLGWDYSGLNGRPNIATITSAQITISNGNNQFPYLAGTYQYVIVKLG